jgi:alkanesulfonate monooxygenase SsuD/methylene tetrahydromethanopterin reductase-like flavin-dependent oxidoreductase (luciferase family)
MKTGFVVPYAAERDFAVLATLGEARGWDGIFTWEALYGIDAWVNLGAAAMVTERIRLGTLLTPASRHRPWDLASKVGSVDRISGGRAVMSVGLGAVHEGWSAFEADEGRAVRARKLDESLAVYAGLLTGQPFSYAGEFYSAKPTDFVLPPDTPQRPHPPVWVVGAPTPGRRRQPSLERAARWQGLIPAIHGPSDDAPKTLEAFSAVVEPVRRLRGELGLPWEGYDVVIEADSWGGFTRLEPAEPAAWEQAGATWWIESWWTVEPGPAGLDEVRRRIEAGPPTW